MIDHYARRHRASPVRVELIIVEYNRLPDEPRLIEKIAPPMSLASFRIIDVPHWYHEYIIKRFYFTL